MTIDWVHCMLADGVLSVEAHLLIASAEVATNDLEMYLKGDWCFPQASRAKSRTLWQLFDSARASSQEKVKGSASEMLGLYSLLRHFVETRLQGVHGIVSQKASFQAACRIVDVILLAKQGRVPLKRASRMLQEALIDHLSKHKHAYGDSNLKPKHHFMFDVADQWQHQAEVVDAFVVERLHLRVKAVAELVRNTTCFERSCLASLINSHCRLLQDGQVGDGLVGRRVALAGTPAQVADSMRVQGMQLSVGDVVFHDGHAGKLNRL